MHRLLFTGLILICCLFVCGILILLFKDRTILVPPPEQVSESFFKQVQMKRYSRALPLLEVSLKREVTPYVLSELRREVESKIGTIQKVKGEKGFINGDTASATAQLKGEKKSMQIEVRLMRQQGVWKVSSVAFRSME